MYRSRCFLNKSTVLSARCHSVTARTRNLVPGALKHGRLMSTKAKLNSNNVYWGYSAAAGLLFAGTVTYCARQNEEFRDAIEDAIPISKQAFNYLLDNDGPFALKKLDVLPIVPLVTEAGEGETDEFATVPNEVLVVNIMDQPFPSQIDFDVGNPSPDDEKEDITNINVVADDVGVEGAEPSAVEDIVVLTVEDVIPVLEEPSVEDIVVLTVEDVIPVEEPSVEDIVVAKEDVIPVLESVPATDEEESIIEVPSLSVVESADEVENAEVEIGLCVDSFAETPLIDDRDDIVEVVEVVSVDTLESLTAVLTTEYENLRIVLRDAITTKSSGAGMLQGYITQLGRALLVPKEDPAYDSIWESTAMLERSVKESIDLVRLKEVEISSQIKGIRDMIDAIHNFGASDIADMTEELITSANEHLILGESEIVTANKKLNFLLGYQKQMKGSSKKVQEYLERFTPDLIKLLNLNQFNDGIDELSNEDAILLFSLRRPELIYAEVQQKEEETQKGFEAYIQEQKEDLTKEAEVNLRSEIEKIEAYKDNELESKVAELNELHENHLQEELKIQADASQQQLESEIAVQKEELDSLHLSEMETKLNEKDEEHYIVMKKNLSYLNGIKSKIGSVADIDEQQRKCQNLWLAAEAFNAALGTVEDGRTKSLMLEISMMMQLGDETLDNIVASIPKAAADLGVVPENVLVQRFTDVKRVCKRVAMVKDEGGSILAYTFSYLKSLLVFSRFYQREFDSEIDLEKIGPYEILEKADYYIQQGDLVQAAKFMSQLKGVPERMCADWLKEVRLLLETKQIADFLMAYASSLVSGFE